MNDYPINWIHICIGAYRTPEEQMEKWPHLPFGPFHDCPRCGLQPKIWTFDNGEHTACGCARTQYDHFDVEAESVGACYRRTGRTKEYNPDNIRKVWNAWCDEYRRKALGGVLLDPAKSKPLKNPKLFADGQILTYEYDGPALVVEVPDRKEK